MEHKITFKTKDGTLKEQRFDDFNQFADTIEEVATGYYAGIRPEIEVETIYQNMVKKERVTENGRIEPEAEFLREEN
ncbi:MAG: hypothetical protein ACO388_07470 [Saprospiraceae bacterium]